MTTCTIKMNLNSVDIEPNRLHVDIKVSFIRASLCACATNFWNLVRKAFNNCMVYSFRCFNHHICMCLCIFVLLAHLSKRLICEIGYSGSLSPVRPSTFSNGFFSETTGPI